MANIKYLYSNIVFQEIPEEISLCIYVTNCPHKCPGCHSQVLWDDVGEDVETNLQRLIDENFGLISCVLFMGGDNGDNLMKCLEICQNNGLKTALYSGCTTQEFNDKYLEHLDYVKIGPYIESLGGLKERTTNQRLYKVDGKYLIDITNKFWEKKEPV